MWSGACETSLKINLPIKLGLPPLGNTLFPTSIVDQGTKNALTALIDALMKTKVK